MDEVTANLTFLKNSTELPDLPIASVILVTTVWSLIIITGAIGNGLVIYILFRFGERSVTNVYIVNLAFADLMFIIFVVPATLIHKVTPTWILGDVICRFSTYMIYVTLHATCLTLSAMTIDRYHAIVNPITSMNWRSSKVSSMISLCVWTVSICISLPFLIYYKEVKINESTHDCSPEWPAKTWYKISSVTVVMTTFVIPLTAILICYGYILHHLFRDNKIRRTATERDGVVPVKNDKKTRQLRRKKRVSRMVAIVVALFAACWFPVHVFALWMQFDENFPRTLTMQYVSLICQTLSYANSCVNPFVYAFVNEGFKQAILKRSPFIMKMCKCVLEENQKEDNVDMIDKSVGTRLNNGTEADYKTTNSSL